MKNVILFVNTLSSGGAERVVSNLSVYLSDKINKSIVIFYAEIEYPYNGELLVFDKPKVKKVCNKLFSFIHRYNQIKKIKKNKLNTPTISFLEQPNLLNILTRNYGKTIVSVRNYMSVKHKSGIWAFFWNLTIKYGYKKADRIIAVSEGIKKDLVVNYKLPESKIDVIYNSYPIKEIASESQKELDNKYNHIFAKPVIITVGRLNKQKGQKHLIRAFKEVKKNVKDAQLVILGEGELYEELIQLTTELKLLSSVHFLGFKNNPFKYIAKSTVFALTSYHEGFPNVLAESMACGIPVVSSDCLSGPREILAPQAVNKLNIKFSCDLNRYGILTPVCNPEINSLADPLSYEEQVLVDSLLALLNNERIRKHFSNQSLIRIKDFDISIIAKEWEKYCE